MKIKTLTISNLYPNKIMPKLGIFTEHRIRNMLKSNRLETKVMAPVPWFPLKSAHFGSYADFARVPKEEIRHGIHILYPRFVTIPKLGMSISPFTLAASLINKIKKLQSDGYDFDLIDAYYYYPDGVAAVLAGLYFKKPVVITAYGNDLSLISHYYFPRKMIQWAANHAAASTTVCQALKDRLVELGADNKSVRVILHGVDLELFTPPIDRASIRKELNLKGPTLLSVGYLIERKGHRFTIEAMKSLPDMELLIAGDGEEEQTLKKLASSIGVSDRVRFLGHVDQQELPRYFGAADALVLASSREGIANVLLESIACGTPVVVTNVWGAPEVITDPSAGVLIPERTADAIVDGVKKLFANIPNRIDTRSFAEQFTWDQTTEQHLELLSEIIKKTGA